MPWIVRYTVNYRGSRNRRSFYLRPLGANNTNREASRFQTKQEAGRQAHYVTSKEIRKMGHTDPTWEFLEVRE